LANDTAARRQPVAAPPADMLEKVMVRWNSRSKWVCALVAIAIYFALAERSIHSYVDTSPRGRVVIRLYPPFEKFGTSKFAVISHEQEFQRSLKDLADSVDDNERSPVQIYENGRLLGPGHSAHGEIAGLGMGRYSHWRGQGYVFSSSDNTDPNSNGRYYYAVIPQ